MENQLGNKLPLISLGNFNILGILGYVKHDTIYSEFLHSGCSGYPGDSYIPHYFYGRSAGGKHSETSLDPYH